jgi:hypothetical protein
VETYIDSVTKQIIVNINTTGSENLINLKRSQKKRLGLKKETILLINILTQLVFDR